MVIWVKRSECVKQLIAGFLLLFSLLITGCSAGAIDKTKKIKDLDFTVVKEENIPIELQEELEKLKKHPFKITFRDQGMLYVCVGYGEQKQGGYSIQVLQFYEAKNGIYVETLLEGNREKNTDGKAVVSCPYIVMMTEYRDLPVIFE